MLLLTDLTSAPDDKSIGIEYCQIIREKLSPIPISMLVPILKSRRYYWWQCQYSDINNPAQSI